MITNYEAMFIFSAQDQIHSTSLEKVRALFKEKGLEIISETDMGIKILGYEIKKNEKGHYHLFNLKFEGTKLKEVNNELKLYEDLLKYMFVKLEKKFFRPKKKNNKKDGS